MKIFKDGIIPEGENPFDPDFLLSVIKNFVRDSKDLRPVEIMFLNGPKKGFFHFWYKAESEGSEFPCAIIELEKGKIISVEATSVTFIDR